MNHAALIARLERFPAALSTAVAVVASDDAAWKPPSGAWSVLEIVRHLVDEERDDFRARLRSTLEDAGRAWPGIDPEGWARERRYNEGFVSAALAEFARERGASVAWLRSLASPDWTATHVHPRAGAIRAGDLLASWAAHDALHLRQVAKRIYELAARDAPGFSGGYAGEWKA
jgi:hypothetical protein